MTQAKSSKTVGLVILHNDLRIHDNACLAKASTTCDALLIVYPKQKLFEPTANRGQAYHERQNNKMGDARKQFLYQSLNQLNTNLKKLGNELLLLDTDKTGINTFNQVKQLVSDFNVGHIFVSNTADYDQNQAYKLLANHIDNANNIANKSPVTWHYATTASIFDKLPTDSAQPNALPKVFTQFRKQVENTHNLLTAENDILIAPTLTVLPSIPIMSDSFAKTIKFDANSSLDVNITNSPFLGGEDQALKHLDDYFNSDSPQSYKETRNTLFLEDNTHKTWANTTRFSPWLANGTLSVRVLLNRLRQYEKKVLANDSTYWIWFELLWREYFYWYGTQHGKKLFRYSGINGKNGRRCFYGERFERWKNGNTNHPIVNACMKQLNATGYMSNRGRQLVASCFIHELGLDWRYGASYFEQQLIDYDVTSNWGNWQYLAGVGADPRGSRKFNLEKQTQQYDPTGAFIAKWQGDVGSVQTDSVDMVDWYI